MSNTLPITNSVSVPAKRLLGQPFMSGWRDYVIFLICTTSVLAAQQPADSGEAARISKEDILFAVEALQSRMRDLTVSFSFNASKPPPGSLHARYHMRAVVKGSKTYFDHEYGQHPANEYRTYSTEIAYNGERTTIHDVRSGVASAVMEKAGETQTQGKGFFDLMLLNPPRKNYPGRSDQSLISLLKSKYSRLRENIEMVDGHPCYVINLYQPKIAGLSQSKRPSMTVWLDRNRGFLPLRSVYYSKPDFEQVVMEFFIEEAVEAGEGLWFAVKGRKKVNPVHDGIDTGEYVLEVDGWQDSNPAIAVNTGVKDEFFDLWKHLPPGTELWDKDADITWTVGGMDFEAAAETFDILLQEAELPVPERSGSQPETSAQKSRSVSLDQPPQKLMAESGETVTNNKVSRTVMLIVAFVILSAMAIVLITLKMKRYRNA